LVFDFSIRLWCSISDPPAAAYIPSCDVLVAATPANNSGRSVASLAARNAFCTVALAQLPPDPSRHLSVYTIHMCESTRLHHPRKRARAHMQCTITVRATTRGWEPGVWSFAAAPRPTGSYSPAGLSQSATAACGSHSALPMQQPGSGEKEQTDAGGSRGSYLPACLELHLLEDGPKLVKAAADASRLLRAGSVAATCPQLSTRKYTPLTAWYGWPVVYKYMRLRRLVEWSWPTPARRRPPPWCTCWASASVRAGPMAHNACGTAWHLPVFRYLHLAKSSP
jgi:hypothetical protein